MENTFIIENRLERDRLKALVSRLSDEEMRKPIGHGWTVSVTLAHLAYWDRKTLEMLERWERGVVRVEPFDADAINDGMLPQWLTMPPSEVALEVVSAAEAVDRKAEMASAELVQAAMAIRPRALLRALHRREHLDEIERALANG